MSFIKNIWRGMRVLHRKSQNLYWRAAKGKFASTRVLFSLTPTELENQGFDHTAAAYDCPIICPAGQKHLFENKLHNLDLAISPMQGLLLKPGEIFSFWGLVGNPTAERGYLEGATFINQRVSSAVGGGLCQLSGLIHNLALLSGCTILERYCHSIDAYGEQRYIPLGRDATVAYPRADLCFQNPHPFSLLLKLEISREKAQGWLYSSQALPYQVEIEVSAPILISSPLIPVTESPAQPLQEALVGKKVDSWRVFHRTGIEVEKEFLFHSFYRPTPTFLRSQPNYGGEG